MAVRHMSSYMGSVKDISSFQKILLASLSGPATLAQPHRGDLLATFGESSGLVALQCMKRRMESDSTGQRILNVAPLLFREKPLIDSKNVDFKKLSELPENSFGKHYSDWLSRNVCFLSCAPFSFPQSHNSVVPTKDVAAFRRKKADPDGRMPIRFISDPELAYVMLRYRQIHDLTHSLYGLDTNWLGEVSVKIIEAIQYGLPMCVLGAAFGPLRFVYYPKHRRRFFNEYACWAVQNGLCTRFLLNVYFEEHWETDMRDLRENLNIKLLAAGKTTS